MFDIKIINGQVLDGTGSSPVRLDVGITGDAITSIGDLSRVEARVTIDASRKVVCPGFIDVHSHSDAFLLIEPSAQSKVYQGITTEVVGNCGASAAPRDGNYKMPSDWADKGYPGQWNSVAEYRALLEKVKPAPNVAILIGHGALRARVVGYDNRPATKDELDVMARLLEKSLDEGGRGLSTGLIYAPGMFASREELVALAKVAAKRGGIYTSHMRSEGKRLLEAIDEAISIGRDGGIRVEISHLKTQGRDNWGLVDAALDRIRRAKKEGLEVAADRYPYTSAQTELDVIFPEWAAAGGREAVMKRLKNKEERARLKEDLLKARFGRDWATITIASTNHPDNRKYQGKALVDVAKSLGMETVDAALHLIETDELRTGAFFSGMSEENMFKILAEPYVMIGTDASLRSIDGPLSHDYPHPRAFGTFPRFLRMSLDGKTVALPEAVRKMTSLPASQFRLAGRGTVTRGQKADVVVFDPDTVHDKSTYNAPHQLSVGIEQVIVNGVFALKESKATGRHSGAVL